MWLGIGFSCGLLWTQKAGNFRTTWATINSSRRTSLIVCLFGLVSLDHFLTSVKGMYEKLKCAVFFYCFVWLWYIVLYSDGTRKIESIWIENAIENIWTWRWSEKQRMSHKQTLRNLYYSPSAYSELVQQIWWRNSGWKSDAEDVDWIRCNFLWIELSYRLLMCRAIEQYVTSLVQFRLARICISDFTAPSFLHCASYSHCLCNLAVSLVGYPSFDASCIARFKDVKESWTLSAASAVR